MSNALARRDANHSSRGLHNFLAGFGFHRVASKARRRVVLSQIRAIAPVVADLSDPALRYRSQQLQKQTVRCGGTLADVPEAFALLDEAVFRSLGLRLYDVQMLGGLSLLNREIAEMKTGEGKTLVGCLVSYARALEGRGVHFMTTNAYLAQRDFDQVKPVLERLGMTVGLVDREMSPPDKRAAYLCDITYGTGYEFGFDYLRDQHALRQDSSETLGRLQHARQRGVEQPTAFQMQREHYCAVIDEADSVLIDEATTPLVLSGSSDQPSKYPQPYQVARDVAAELCPEIDFHVERARYRVKLTRTGQAVSLEQLDATTRSMLRRPWIQYVEKALHANCFFRRDAEYLIRDDKVLLVDQNTGRVFEDRTWSDGLHQAVEAKESVTISEENHSLATISRQQYFRLYDNLCGMTGTASDSKSELRAVYGLAVTKIATHRPSLRIEHPMRSFGTAAAKWDAIASSTRELHASGRPVLIGTRTIEASEIVASRLSDLSVQILNGKQDAEESELVAAAGQLGAITIATNMAGRGTDIRLAEGVAEIGGLHVIMSEPHDSARVDRQLFGRASRQGDPGSYQIFVSAEDQLLVQHATWLCRHIRRLADACHEVKLDLSSEVEKTQRAVERKFASERRLRFSGEQSLEQTKSTLV